MIARLLLFIFGCSVPIVTLGSFFYREIVAPRLKARAYRRLGVMNAFLTCSSPECLKKIDINDEDAIFEHKKWWHRNCLKKLLA